MKIEDRKKIFNKYGGKCAYCGCELEKGWHIDHREPVGRHLFSNEMSKPERDCIDNMMPSCPSCNNYKHSFSLETFRGEISLLTSRLNARFTQYKIAKRYGLIKETGIEVKFYFETITLPSSGE